MQRPQAALLPDGRRLHLQHGPIDLIVGAEGQGRDAAFRRATARFQTILEQLVAELPSLRTPADAGVKPLASGLTRFENRVARRLQTPSAPPPDQFTTADRMRAAVSPFAEDFITPMAAVAGAVADEILQALCDAPGLRKAHVNNGGDVAFHLGPGQRIDAAVAAASPTALTVTHDMPWRGVATSGWRGRSQSLGIADSVTVLARNAAGADAAATLIANAVDLPGHPGIARVAARDLKPDSDLDDRPVTTAVSRLRAGDRHTALDRGQVRAETYLRRGLIGAACLVLQGELRLVGPQFFLSQPEPLHA